MLYLFQQGNHRFEVEHESVMHSIPLGDLQHSFPRLLELRGDDSAMFIGMFVSSSSALYHPAHMASWGLPSCAKVSQSSYQAKMPNPVRAQAKGRPYFSIWIKLWGDDVSGNRSKQWNKHWNWYFAIAGLPKRLLHQEYFVHFLSTSPYASVLEQAKAICDQVS